jgi:hypothetical protein
MLVLLTLTLIALACTCGPLNTVTQIQTTVGAARETIGPVLTDVQQNKPTLDAMATELSLTADAALGTAGAIMPELETTLTAIAGQAALGAELRQWAASATASSEYGNPDWSAIQATGAPNTSTCGDLPTAWASANKNEFATLTLSYATPVIPTRVEIHQTYSPGSIVKVEVADGTGASSTIYEGQPNAIKECPHILIIPITGVATKVNTITVSIDQSVVGDWNEIDAVELIGMH